MKSIISELSLQEAEVVSGGLSLPAGSQTAITSYSLPQVATTSAGWTNPALRIWHVRYMAP